MNITIPVEMYGLEVPARGQSGVLVSRFLCNLLGADININIQELLTRFWSLDKTAAARSIEMDVPEGFVREVKPENPYSILESVDDILDRKPDPDMYITPKFASKVAWALQCGAVFAEIQEGATASSNIGFAFGFQTKNHLGKLGAYSITLRAKGGYDIKYPFRKAVLAT